MDLFKVKDGHYKEALYFFEYNWKVYRDSALKAGHIKSFRMLRNVRDSSNADIVLVTEYHDRASYDKREEYFQPIMKALRPNGAASLNGLKRDQIVSFVGSFLTEALD